MRQIKFRWWNDLLKEMVFFDGWLPAEHDDAMQWTGITDLHGVEIYEGDIVSGRSYGQYKEQGIVTYGEYEYGEGADRYKNIGWYLSRGKYQHPLAMINVDFYDSWAKAKVIGNIWENEDLLK